MTRLLPFLILIGLVAELASIIVVGNLLGLVPTLLLLLAGGVLGIGLIRSAGTSIVAAIRSPVQASSLQQSAAGKAMARAFSGLLFIIPGFFSDFIGLLLLIPQFRRWLRSRIPVQTVSAGMAQKRHGETIIEAEAVEIVGELHSPHPAQGQDKGGAERR
jgi:UPF0716 protein FxsA